MSVYHSASLHLHVNLPATIILKAKVVLSRDAFPEMCPGIFMNFETVLCSG